MVNINAINYGIWNGLFILYLLITITFFILLEVGILSKPFWLLASIFFTSWAFSVMRYYEYKYVMGDQ